MAVRGDDLVSSFRVRVVPGASRTRILGIHAEALRLAVSAAPEKGRANRAVVQLVAEWLSVARTSVGVVRGKASRDKWIQIEGLAPDDLRRRIGRRLSGGRSAPPI